MRKVSVALLFALLITLTAHAAALHPIERQVRDRFPSVALDSQATVETAQEIVAGRAVSGMRARQSQLRVFYPGSYDEAFVAELGEQRVALRAVGAHVAPATASAGKLFYAGAHDSVDVIEVPGTWQSEELLVLHDERAPRVFEYEIIEMRGVSAVILHDGAIRFILAGRSLISPQLSLQIDRPWVIDANGKRPENAAHWTIIEKNGQPLRIQLTVSSDALAYPLVVDPSFSATGSMSGARREHTATPLPNGKVLIAGGFNGAPLNTVRLYEPATGTFTNIGIMTVARSEHTALLLPNGKVLITGGQTTGGGYLNTAELYDPANGTFTATTGSMTASRHLHTATLLPNGKVLIAAGQTTGGAYVNTAELYDPAGGANGTFTAIVANMTAGRADHTATLLQNGKVLIAGGYNPAYLNTAELYDPAGGTNGTFTAVVATMTAARGFHTTTLLPNGKALIAGGYNGAWLNTAELYDPVGGTNGTFTATGGMTARSNHTATLLPSGKVLIAGGAYSGGQWNTAELYDSAAGTFTATVGTMTSARFSHSATMLSNGKVLITGGHSGVAYLNTAEAYDYAEGTFTATGTMTVARQYHAASLLPNGKVLITGGFDGTAFLNTAELYDAAAGTFTATGTMTEARLRPTATLLPNGKVLIAGSESYLNTAELYDPAAGTFTATGTITMARGGHTATLLPNGKVLIAGGCSSGIECVKTAELYNPATSTFIANTGIMTSERAGHTATLLPNGKVLIAGGGDGTVALKTAELYDPAAGTFTATGTMTVARSANTATLLPNGKVLIAGGATSVYLNTAELYDPAAGTFTATPANMTVARGGHTATLLPNGKVLIAGGGNSGGYLNTAELYDPAAGTFAATAPANMTVARYIHAATLLPNGKVLIAGGYNSSSEYLNTAELYDVGLGYTEARRPVVSSLTNFLCQPGNLSLSGSLFTGDSEGSSGSTGSSSANAPLLRLLRVDNDQLSFAAPQSFSASAYFSATLNNLAAGHYRVGIVSNAIPSPERIIEVATTPLLGTYGNGSVNLSGSTTVTPSSLPAGYNGAFYPLAATASIGFTGTLSINGNTGVVTVNNAGPPGTYTITVSSSTICGSPSTTFTLDVIGPPDSVTATGGTPQSAQVNTPFGSHLVVTVEDSAGHPLQNVTVTFTAPASGASATLVGNNPAITGASGHAIISATANGTLGSYNVTAHVGGLTATFALTNTPATPTNVFATAVTPTSVSVVWTGTAGATYEVLRQAAGGVTSTVGSSPSGSLTDNTATADTAYLYRVRAIAPALSPYGIPDLATTVIFTDPTITAGVTIVKAAHFTELRTAVNAVRTLAGLAASSFTDATLTPGSTVINAVHLTQLRTALDAARSSLLLPPISYVNPTITAGTTAISAAHINDLRNGVK